MGSELPPQHRPRQQRYRRRCEHDPHSKPNRLCHRRARGSRPHPADSQSSQHQRQKKCSHTNQLQHRVGKISAHNAGPVMRWPPRDIVPNRIERGVGRGVAGQGEQQQRRAHQYNHPDNLIQTAIARRGRYESYGFHWGAFIEGDARPLSPQRSRPAAHRVMQTGAVNLQSTSDYPRARPGQEG